MSQLSQDLRYAIRTYIKAPAFTVVALLVLALGIGANSAIFTLVNALLLHPLSGRAGELVGLYSHDSTKPDSYRSFSYPNYVDIRERGGVFASLMAHTFTMVGVPAGQGEITRRTFVEMVSSNYFDTLGVRLAAGRTFSDAEERPGARIPVVITSYSRWQAEGLRPDFIGGTMRINAIDFTIVGVAPKRFTGTMAVVAPEMYLPLGMFDVVVTDIFKNKGTGLDDRSHYTLILAGRLQPSLDAATANARLQTVSRELERAYPAENRNQLLTIADLPRMSTSTSPQTDGPLAIAAGVFLALSGVVLLIASLNIANMLLARGMARRREIAVRLAIGANRRRIVRQLLTEGFALAAAGAAGGLLLAYWTMDGLMASMAVAVPMPMTLESAPDRNVLLATVAFAFISTLLFGLGPALRLSRRDLVTDLKDSGVDASPARRLFGGRNLLVMAQLALSLMLLTAGGMFARSAFAARLGDPGYRYDRLLLTSLDPTLAGFDDARGRAAFRSVLERVRALPGVEATGMSSTVPFGEFREGKAIERVGARTSEPANATYRIIGADYFAALGLGLVRGRAFDRREEELANAAPVAIIDEALAVRLFGAEDPLGQMIRFRPRPDSNDPTTPMEIVGIAPPVREEMMQQGAEPHVYVPSGRFYRSGMHLHTRVAQAGNEAQTLADIRREIRNVDERLPIVESMTMAAFHRKSLELWLIEAGGKMLTTLGLLALALAVVGVYGVKAYVVSQRTREIGIRMALGADRGDVLRLLVSDGARLTMAGLAIGLPFAVLIAFAVSKALPNVTPFDPLVLAGAPVILGVSALVASFLPARRAAKVEPLTALRQE